MEQSELNGIAQRWLEGLVQLQKSINPKSNFPLLTPKGMQDLSNVLESLASGMKITLPLKTSLHAGGTHLAVLARGLSSYLSVALEGRDVDAIAGLVHAHVTQSLLSLLGLEEADDLPKASIFHDDVREGFVRVFQMALYKKYDKMATEGLLAASNKPPVVYVGGRGEIGLLYHVCARIGIPASCVNIVPCSTSPGASHTIDVNALEKLINDDCNQGKTPLLVVAYAGTPLAGHIEDFQSLRSVCNRYNMWLHATGHGLSSLCIQDESDELLGVSAADSITIFPGTWFGILSCPMITMHRHPKVIQTNGLPTSANFPGENLELGDGEYPIPGMFWSGLYPYGLPKLLPLSLWVCLQYLGTSALVDTVSYCRSLTKSMIALLDEIPGITRLYAPVNHTAHVVLFKYTGGGQLNLPASFKSLITPQSPSRQEQEEKQEPQSPMVTENGSEVPPDTDNTPVKEEVPTKETEANVATPEKDSQNNDDDSVVVTIHGMPPAITNMYNLMLSTELKAHFPKLGLATYDMGGKDGVVFRFDPTVSFPEHSTSIEDIEKFAMELKAKLDTLHPIAQARCFFEVALRGRLNLRWMEFPNLHCVAVFQFVPSDWVGKQELVLDEVNELNRLNLELCQQLANKISVFSPFQHGNFTCIIIKELAEGKTMFELLDTLLVEVKNFEDHKEFLRNMAVQIQEGIKAAQSDLIKEKNKEEEEEGILKYVPIVGSVVGWLYPTSPTTRTGRTFDLSSGKVEDTSKVYKNRLQLIEEKGIEAVPTPNSNTPEKGATPVSGTTPTQQGTTTTPIEEDNNDLSSSQVQDEIIEEKEQ